MSRKKALVLTLGLLGAIVGAVAFGSALMWIMGPRVSVSRGSVLEVTLGGPILETPSDNPLVQLLQAGVPNLFDLGRVLKQAARDDRIEGLYLEIHPLLIGWGQVEELRDYIRDFRRSGKPVHAFLPVDAADEKEVYLATCADSVTLNAGAGLLVNGLLAEVTFYRGSLEKLEVKPDFIQFKEYKHPGSYTRDGMTPEFRGMLESVLRDIENRFVAAVAKDRKISEAALRQVMALGIVTDKFALKEKLIDAAGYKEQVRQRFERPGAEYRGVSWSRYAETTGKPWMVRARLKVALVAASGTIVAGYGESFTETLGGSTMARTLRQLREDDSIKGVILRVDSPGGSAVGSDMVWEEVRLLEEADKPVVVSMSSVAGSGGYYIAMPARCLVAQPSTITGSIGVYFGKFDLSGLYRWLGMRVEQVKLSPSADILSMFDSLDPDQKRQVESWVGSTYDTFVAKAAQGRGMTVEQMEPKARGRIYTGAQAKKAGLVDDIGGLGVAMERMRGFLKLKKDDTLELVLYPRPKTLWESLSSGDFLPVQQHPPRLREWLEAEGKDLSTPAPWAIMPEVQIR